MNEMATWRHVFKLDPNKHITDGQLEQVCESGTDAIVVGGTDGVTLENVIDLLARVRRFSVPCALEVSNIEAITPGFDYYFIPMVLNSRDLTWLIDLHHEAVKQFGDLINWEELFVEGYCILNAECKAASLTSARTELTDEDVIAYARMAEHMYRFPIFYMEYSGQYGDVMLVEKVKRTLQHTRLFYGGGIHTPEQAKEMAMWADTVVVGNVIYTNLPMALQTVEAVKGKRT
ncbi:putative glycerol-1-phosphate prenyltransferase [Anoxybacillus pushchinoensis]|jgi:putative glycerol-1-phosphate prenyltransferase|uniref:Heptaprenylglyceryl phosphate synthase n=1 Tax=Anoxybacillus pushchinoensis TaxID=150248 RepID=A0A1I0TCU4_9BACL|nr:heptaprenylglyceryl phosphate synthase [Anoxybacillus pushchinoensis]SFA49527.1 putative glycerol-1-phosphate prenyltransferase [Anoxybacillus pushchinoensis]